MDARGFLLRHKYELAFLAAVFAFALFIRLDGAPAGLFWDEGRYSSFGRELMDHPLEYSTKYLEGGGPVTLYSPLLPYLLMLSQFVLGAGQLLSVQIVNILLGALSCVAIYFLGKCMFNWRVGLTAAILLSVSPIFWFYNSRVLLETPLTFFMILAMALFWRGFEIGKTKSAIAAGASTALAYLARVSGGILLPIQAIYLLITRGIKTTIKDKKVWLFLAAAAAVVSPWFVRNLFVCGNIECGALQSGISVVTGTRAGAFDFFLFQWLAQYPTLLTWGVTVFAVLGLLFVAARVVNKRRTAKAEILLLLWWGIIMAALTQQWGSGGQDFRHIVYLVPPLVLLAAVAIDRISDMFSKIKFAPLVVILIILAPFGWLSYSAGYGTVSAGRDAFAGLDSVGNYIRENYPNGSKIICGSPNQIAFFAGPADYNISHMWYNLRENQSLSSFLKEHGFDAIAVDAYERLQPSFVLDHNYMNGLPYLKWESAFYHKGNTVAIMYNINKEILARVVD